MKTTAIRNILVPIDFSDLSIQAIETAKTLARRSGATIHLVHVHQFQYPTGLIGPALAPGDVPFTFQEHRTNELIKELRTVAKNAGLSSRDQAHIRSAIAPFDAICRLARELPADLIVLPTHGHTGLKHVFLGSTAERVVQHSPCPVFVVRNAQHASINTILVPVDFSKASLAVLKAAIALAEEIAARLIVFHASYLGYIYSADGYALYDLEAMEKALRQSTEQQMRDFVRMVNFGSVKFETVIRSGPPVEEISAFAKDRAVDLILTATHGWTGLRHVLLGSTAERIVRHAPCSIMVLPSHPAVRESNLKRALQRQPIQQKMLNGKRLSRKDRKLVSHPFPERRQTNKFREAHARNGRL
jgi:nucleotide-binding universal stress UspA family protein